MSRAHTSQKKEQLTLPLPPPRNPVAVAGRQRRAGSHRKNNKQQRLALGHALRKETDM